MCNARYSAWAHVLHCGLPPRLGDADRGQIETQLDVTARRCRGGWWTGAWREGRHRALGGQSVPGKAILVTGHDDSLGSLRRCLADACAAAPAAGLARGPRRGRHLIPAIAA
jgi:hypothetical protein